jgi:hypothetical protein
MRNALVKTNRPNKEVVTLNIMADGWTSDTLGGTVDQVAEIICPGAVARK